jgi:hypothetical protein
MCSMIRLLQRWILEFRSKHHLFLFVTITNSANVHDYRILSAFVYFPPCGGGLEGDEKGIRYMGLYLGRSFTGRRKHKDLILQMHDTQSRQTVKHDHLFRGTRNQETL